MIEVATALMVIKGAKAAFDVAKKTHLKAKRTVAVTMRSSLR